MPSLPGLLSSLAASANAALISCTVDHTKELWWFKLLTSKIRPSSRTVAAPKELGSKEQNATEDNQLRTLALVEFQGAIVNVYSLQVSPEFKLYSGHMIVCIASLDPAVCVLMDYGTSMDHLAMHIHTILYSPTRGEPIRTLFNKLLFLTSTPFDKLIEMNDGVRLSVSYEVISNISEAVISINQIIPPPAMHQPRAVSVSALHNSQTNVVMVTRGSPLMRSKAKCLVLDGTGASFLDS